ncbi:hypothetical protein [Cytobacillus dafuensis]|uniref:Alpha/beta hydrolase n=1 Tax=Cytobacillus dafuensis TaxID=1742359 RepID=A0A5B8Z072_CYTDA|nr:hypothetical protein [Cytobacillus dafuensis]QED46295.1 alpha/beta hydrolase [Cytobacillus dafuensis]
MKLINDHVKCNTKIIPYSLFKQEKQTNTLAILLPGAGYTNKAPLLHYSTGVFYTRGYDVLHVNYEFSKEELSSLNENEFTSAVQTVIDKALKENHYTDYYFIAKSLGTITLAHLLENPSFHSAKAIWLTPLLQKTDVYNALLKSKNQGLCIIGDKDPCYIGDRFEAISHNKNLSLRLIEGVNHALEFKNNVMESIDVLKNVIRMIDEF